MAPPSNNTRSENGGLSVYVATTLIIGGMLLASFLVFLWLKHLMENPYPKQAATLQTLSQQPQARQAALAGTRYATTMGA